MALDLSMFIADLQSIEADITQTFTWGGASYACVASEVVRGRTMEMEGVYGEFDLQIVVRRALLPSVPGVNNAVTYEGRKFRIDRVGDSPDGVSVNLWCVAGTA